jgi:small subunit ribosomal protein S9
MVKKTSKEKKEKYFEAVGRRKTAVARVRLFARKGGLTVNNKDYRQYFPIFRLQQKAFSPLEKTQLNNKLEAVVKVSGSGPSSQAEAVRHGLARTLVLFKPDLKSQLKNLGYLKRDSRMVERKKYGLKKARRAPQWAKR